MTPSKEMPNINGRPLERILQPKGVDNQHGIVEVELGARFAISVDLVVLAYNGNELDR